MDALDTIRILLAYSDETNTRLIDAAAGLTDVQLDQPFDMGMGTLRKTLSHIFVGEAAWLARWKQTPGFKWSSVAVPGTIVEMRRLDQTTRADRDAFLDSVTAESLAADQVYLDSTAGEFIATLHDQIIQGIVHSTHHRAQAVNMIRRLGGPLVDVDFMYARRRPVPR